jgi:hypothetical protein
MLDDLVKSLKLPIFVIPAKAGIQFFQVVTTSLDSGFHRSDDFLRNHHVCLLKKIPIGYLAKIQETTLSFVPEPWE